MGLLSWYYGVDESERQIAEANSKLAELNARKGWAAPRDLVNGRQVADISEDFEAGFVADVRANADSLRRGATNAITGTLGIGLRLIPWPVWVAAGAIALFYAWPVIGPFVNRAVKRFVK